ncbi:MAG: hypothetical protein GF333_07975 [Candidatus Omnitrophica bacterium]|nr:hypothetical protein [Candidatus Omnitrophota bacterium]
MNKWRKSQSMIDYAALIALVSISLIAMSGYVFRAIHARVHRVRADLNHPQMGVR